MFKVCIENTRTVCEIYSKLIAKLSERCQRHLSGVLSLILKKNHTFFWCFHGLLQTGLRRHVPEGALPSLGT